MQPDVNKPDPATMLRELVDLEIPCEDTDCVNGSITLRAGVTDVDYLRCETCKGTGKVLAFSMLRKDCDAIGWHDRDNFDDDPKFLQELRTNHYTICPGYRAKTLDEARLCLEELLVAEKVTVQPTLPQHEREHAWYASIGNIEYYKDAFGDTPTEAIISAIMVKYKGRDAETSGPTTS